MVQDHIREAIAAIVWPPNNDRFLINPVRKGNGVVPIKKAFVDVLKLRGWKAEQAAIPSTGRGRVDAALTTAHGTYAVEWETGNISSSHRSLMRLSLGLIKGDIKGGVLVLPSKKLYRYLTDRVGNIDELERYFPVWRALPITAGALVVIEIEQDDESSDVELIRKGTDGWALVQRGTPDF